MDLTADQMDYLKRRGLNIRVVDGHIMHVDPVMKRVRELYDSDLTKMLSDYETVKKEASVPYEGEAARSHVDEIKKFFNTLDPSLSNEEKVAKTRSFAQQFQDPGLVEKAAETAKDTAIGVASAVPGSHLVIPEKTTKEAFDESPFAAGLGSVAGDVGMYSLGAGLLNKLKILPKAAALGSKLASKVTSSPALIKAGGRAVSGAVLGATVPAVEETIKTVTGAPDAPKSFGEAATKVGHLAYVRGNGTRHAALRR